MSNTITQPSNPFQALQAKFPEHCSPTLGVEVEMGMVDRITENPKPLFREFYDSAPEEMRPQIHPEYLTSQVEFVTQPHKHIGAAANELRRFERLLTGFAAQHGAKLSWKANFPNWQHDPAMVTECERAAPLQQRLGLQTRQLATNSMHFHVAVPHKHAMHVMDGLQLYLPLFVSLAANSPIAGGERTGHKSQRVAVWSSGFAVCGLSEPYRHWSGFDQRMQKLAESGRIRVPKDNYSFVRPTSFGTIELRCCDLPANMDQVVALAALYQTLVVGLQEGVVGGRQERDVLRAELHAAYTDGMQAQLLDHRGNLRSPIEWLQRLVYDLEPIAASLGTDTALALAASTLESNGAEQQLAAWNARPQYVVPSFDAAVSGWTRRRLEVGAVTAAGLSGLLAGFFAQ